MIEFFNKEILNLKNFILNRKIAQRLRNFNLENIPNLLFCGPDGSGKTFLINSFLNHIFKKQVVRRERMREFRTKSNQIIELQYYDSTEHIEIIPAELGIYDSIVIIDFLKEMGQTKPILSYFDKKMPKYKFIIIYGANDLSAVAQAALRRTIEQFSNTLRLILVADSTDKIIEPILSRTYNITVGRIPISELNDFYSSYGLNDLKTNNLHKINRLLLQQTILNTKKIKGTGLLDYEIKIEQLCKAIESKKTVIELRKLLEAILIDFIEESVIAEKIYKYFIVKDIDELSLSVLYRKYKGRMVDDKAIIHIEAFIVNLMDLLK